MKWITLQYERQEVNAARRCLIADEGGNLSMHHDHMLDVINNWRSSHSFPLQGLKMTLLRRARTIDERAIVAQRLKRLSSIDAKLRQHSDWMKLTQMQDIGGSRAIVENMARLNSLIKSYEDAIAKNPKRHFLHKKNDYISGPKDDGYRSYHLVFRYRRGQHSPVESQ
jgi:ppGpp synthetase/RelA/SpoT-type nucleotidyltranferase